MFARSISVVLLLLTLGVGAQQLYVGPADTTDMHWAEATDFDGSFILCRGAYTADRDEANGSGWGTDYPGADHNLLVRLSMLTRIPIRFVGTPRYPVHVVVRLDDPLLLFRCPVILVEDVGVLRFTESEVVMLRRYFEAGGFLWADDFWGDQAWDQWEHELRRVLPAYRYPMIDIPPDHTIMHMLYAVDHIPQQPTIGLWAPGHTSERGEETKEVHFRGVLDARGRLIAVMTHNTDIVDGMEEEKPENQAYIREFSASSYAIGVNIVLYALTH